MAQWELLLGQLLTVVELLRETSEVTLIQSDGEVVLQRLFMLSLLRRWADGPCHRHRVGDSERLTTEDDHDIHINDVCRIMMFPTRENSRGNIMPVTLLSQRWNDVAGNKTAMEIYQFFCGNQNGRLLMTRCDEGWNCYKTSQTVIIFFSLIILTRLPFI